jgi:hypothetical protein
VNPVYYPEYNTPSPVVYYSGGSKTTPSPAFYSTQNPNTGFGFGSGQQQYYHQQSTIAPWAGNLAPAPFQVTQYQSNNSSNTSSNIPAPIPVPIPVQIIVPIIVPIPVLIPVQCHL